MNDRKKENAKNKSSFVIEDTTYYTKLTTKYRQRKRWKKSNPNYISSIIPGTILEVNVEVGDTVKFGCQLLVIEAMKMKNDIKMPFDGEIIKVNVKKNQSIPKNYLMVEIKPI